MAAFVAQTLGARVLDDEEPSLGVYFEMQNLQVCTLAGVLLPLVGAGQHWPQCDCGRPAGNSLVGRHQNRLRAEDEPPAAAPCVVLVLSPSWRARCELPAATLVLCRMRTPRAGGLRAIKSTLLSSESVALSIPGRGAARKPGRGAESIHGHVAENSIVEALRVSGSKKLSAELPGCLQAATDATQCLLKQTCSADRSAKMAGTGTEELRAALRHMAPKIQHPSGCQRMQGN